MIAGAAAPGFSPLLGSPFDGLFGWRVTFLVVAAFGVVGRAALRDEHRRNASGGSQGAPGGFMMTA